MSTQVLLIASLVWFFGSAGLALLISGMIAIADSRGTRTCTVDVAEDEAALAAA